MKRGVALPASTSRTRRTRLLELFHTPARAQMEVGSFRFRREPGSRRHPSQQRLTPSRSRDHSDSLRLPPLLGQYPGTQKLSPPRLSRTASITSPGEVIHTVTTAHSASPDSPRPLKTAFRLLRDSVEPLPGQSTSP